MPVVMFVLGLSPVAAVLGVLALQRKWYALGVFAAVVVALCALLVSLIAVATGQAPAAGEPPPEGFDRIVFGAAYAVVFADLAALLATPALFMRWGRDRGTR